MGKPNKSCGVGPTKRSQKGGGQKFRALFFLLPPKLHSLCSLWAPFRGISVVFEVLGPSKMHNLASLGHRVKHPKTSTTFVERCIPRKALPPKKVAPTVSAGKFVQTLTTQPRRFTSSPRWYTTERDRRPHEKIGRLQMHHRQMPMVTQTRQERAAAELDAIVLG